MDAEVRKVSRGCGEVLGDGHPLVSRWRQEENMDFLMSAEVRFFGRQIFLLPAFDVRCFFFEIPCLRYGRPGKPTPSF